MVHILRRSIALAASKSTQAKRNTIAFRAPSDTGEKAFIRTTLTPHRLFHEYSNFSGRDRQLSCTIARVVRSTSRYSSTRVPRLQ